MSGRILVVTDTQSSGRVLEARLSADSHVVDLVLGGADCPRLAAGAVDVVLVDAVAPGSEAWRCGLDLLRAPVPRPAPLLILSRREEPTDRLAALEAGATTLLTHPVASAEVLAAVRAMVRRKRVDDEEQARADTAHALGATVMDAAVHAPHACRVLLIDDHPSDPERLARLLGDALIHVEHAGLGHDGVDLAAAATADLVLLGLDLLAEDALHVLSRLRAAPGTRETPVLALAGAEAAARVARAYDLGITDCVHRAASAAELLTRVRRQLRGEAARRARRLEARRAVSLGVRDRVTGLFSQRFLARHLADRLEVLPAGELGLLLVDVDYLATVNERFGQPAGDGVLIAVAHMLRACVRGVDLVARHGACSLAIMLPGAGATEARAVAARLRVAVAAMVVEPLAGETYAPTVSIGAVASGGRAITSHALLDEADAALRLAKREGRNRVQGETGLRDVSRERLRA